MTPLEAAHNYLKRGFAPIPLPIGAKNPTFRNWTALKLTDEQLDTEFKRPGLNIGLLLGDPSNGLVDVDLDCEEALDLADQYLPSTPAITGRPGKPRSHRWYIAPGAKTKQFHDPTTRAMIVELRSTGGQTVVGPSVHPAGEIYDSLTATPAVVAAPMLLACVQALANAVSDRRQVPILPPPPPVVHEQPGDLETRVIAYLRNVPGAISGSGGHSTTFSAATSLVHGFGLDPERAYALLATHYNPKCQPPWSEKELRHKIDSAGIHPPAKPRGWLLEAPPPHPSVHPSTDVSCLVGQAWGQLTDPNVPPHVASRSSRPVGQSPQSIPEPLDVGDLVLTYPHLRPPLIHGLLRVGETMNIIAASKTGKSWLATDLALAIGTGRPWLNCFDTVPGRVLILDNELHRETSAHRIGQVAAARQVDLESLRGTVFIENLRGRLSDIHSLGQYFQSLPRDRFQLIIIDAFYRVLPPNMDENDNGAMASVFNSIDRIADSLNCSFVLIHHSSKGNQSGKAVTDVGAGAGSQSRATDTHLVLRPHEEADAIVLDGAVRSFPPVSARCLRWSFPIWIPDDGLDPASLRVEKPRKRVREPESNSQPEWTVERFAEAFVTTMPRHRGAIVVEAKEQAGLTERRVLRLLKQAVNQGLIHRWKRHGNRQIGYATQPMPDTKREQILQLLEVDPSMPSREIERQTGASRAFVTRVRRESRRPAT